MIRDIEDLPEPDLFKKMITVSLALHISVFLFFGLKALFFPHEPLSLDPSVRVDIVDLPDKISELPQKTQEPVSKAPPVPVPVPKPLPKKLSAIEKIKQFEKEEHRKKTIENIEKEVEKQ